jgi:hypothetical protein
MQSCQSGSHVLYRNDAILSARFNNISDEAKRMTAPRQNWIVLSLLATITLLCGIVGTVIFVQYRRKKLSDDDLPNYPNHSDYSPINNLEDV